MYYVLLLFFYSLFSFSVCWPYSWLLDSPFLWDSPKKFSFVRKIHCRFYHSRDIPNLNKLNSLLDATYSLVNTSWFRLIPPGQVRLISNRTLTDQLYKRQQRGGRRPILFDNIFLGMIILCKNVVGHLSTYIVSFFLFLIVL